MKYLKKYKLFEAKSYTKEDRYNLNELSQDIRNIMLDIIDEYQLIDVEPSNAGHLDLGGYADEDIDYELGETPNSYFISNEVVHTKHGAYGMVVIKINCKKLYDEVSPSMGKEESLFKELITRLDTIGNSYVEFEENGLVTRDGDLLRIEVTQK